MGHQTCKNRRLYNLYCAGADVKPCSINLCNFSTYFKWSEEDELFRLRASLKDPPLAGQLLRDLGSNVTLAELVRLLCNRFGTSNQAERFLRSFAHARESPGQLQKLYNDTCRLMSLAYPGLSSEIVNVVGTEAFLDALGDPSLRVRVLDKGPTNMEDALRVALWRLTTVMMWSQQKGEVCQNYPPRGNYLF